MSYQQLCKLHHPRASCLLEQRTLGKASVTCGLGIRARAMFETPLRELQVVVLESQIQIPARARPITAHVQHAPLRIVPVPLPPNIERALVDQFEKPDDITARI